MSDSDCNTETLLSRSMTGDHEARDELFGLVYKELKAVARKLFRTQRAGHTLQPTALVHEAYARLVDADKIAARDREHFLAIASRAMRQILVDHARARATDKRGGGWERVSLDGSMQIADSWIADAVDLDAALAELERIDERKARVVELRFFGGMNVDEVASVLGVSRSTVEGDWRFARAWLSNELAEDDPT